MDMNKEIYTIIAATNRKESNSFLVGKHYQQKMATLGISADLYSLENLDLNRRSPSVVDFEQKALIPTQKFIIIAPEYNGSYPGVLKSLIDLSSIKEVWPGKKALLTGVATGRGGNIRGLEHLTGTLNYLNVFVHPNRLPLSLIHEKMDLKTGIIEKQTSDAIDLQIADFIKF
jgi:NAD(P)H-dependent FMN reductase